MKKKEKKKGTTQCNKRTVTYDKNRVDAILVLLNMTMKSSNLRKKNKGTTICGKKKKLSNMILELHNAIMEPSNVKKKIREPPNKQEKEI